MRRSSLLVAVPALLLLLAACGSADDDSSGTVAPVTTSGAPAEPSEPTDPTVTVRGTAAVPPSTGSPDPSPSSGPAGTVGRGRDVERAIADLVERAGVDADAITVVAAENVTWRDSSIGCPRPGMQYMQVVTDGVRIILEADGQRYEYHAGGRRPVFYCASPEPPVGE